MTNNVKTPIFDPKIIKIDEEKFIKIQMYEYRGNQFYDVVLTNLNNEVFIGRFDKNNSEVKVAYNDGKILIYQSESDNKDKSYISKVISLYDILDDTFYACTEKEALQIFSQNLNPVNLKNKNNTILRRDLEKRKRLLKK